MGKDYSKKLFIGTSGFAYDKWIGIFYPDDLPKTKSLDYYVKHFNSVEVNSSFYRTPSMSTVEKWKDKAPENFVFTFKASRYISHIKRLNITRESWHKFYDPLTAVANPRCKHAILYQFPANFKKNIERLENLLKGIPKEFRHAFEFRHDTWFDEETFDVLRKFNAALVFADSPIEDGHHKWTKVQKETADFFYIRFHGSRELYTSEYTDEELDDYAALLANKLERGLDVYAYFNNDSKGAAPFDAQRLRARIEKSTEMSLLKKFAD